MCLCACMEARRGCEISRRGSHWWLCGHQCGYWELNFSPCKTRKSRSLDPRTVYPAFYHYFIKASHCERHECLVGIYFNNCHQAALRNWLKQLEFPALELKKELVGVGETNQQFNTLGAFSEDRAGLDSHPRHPVSSVIPVPGDLTPFSDLCGDQAHTCRITVQTK